jgi:hypothetical protein
MTYVTLEINNYAPTPMIRCKNEMLHDLQDRQEAYHIGRKESTADTSSLNETSKQAQRQQQIYLQREMVIQNLTQREEAPNEQLAGENKSLPKRERQAPSIRSLSRAPHLPPTPRSLTR